MAEEKKLSPLHYLLFNLGFWIYGGLILLFIKVTLKETTGLYLFFLILAVAFALVSVFDYCYDRIAAPSGREAQGSRQTNAE